jgi:hypothetical protein
VGTISRTGASGGGPGGGPPVSYPGAITQTQGKNRELQFALKILF